MPPPQTQHGSEALPAPASLSTAHIPDIPLLVDLVSRYRQHTLPQSTLSSSVLGRGVE